MRHVSKKKAAVFASAVVTGPTEGFIGDPPQQFSVVGRGTDGQPFPAVVTGWRSSNSAIASIDATGLLTNLTEGEVTVQALVAGTWWD